MTIEDYMAVPSECRAMCWSSVSATTPVGPSSNDRFCFLTFDDGGLEIASITEVVDSKAAKELLSRLVDAGLIERHGSHDFDGEYHKLN